MIDREFIASCYRVFLDREPENSEVVDGKLAAGHSLEDLVREFVSSAEFQNRVPRRAIEDHYFRRETRVDIGATEAQQEQLFRRIQSQWRALGQNEPFWSVLTHDEFRLANIDDDARANFYETGKSHAEMLPLFCRRNNLARPSGVCLEFGCGVGRVTKHLADQFETVIAIDVSEGNIDQCRRMLEDFRIRNVTTTVVAHPDQLLTIQNIDCFYSTIVLQHNPPPLQAILISRLLSKLTPGGVFLFQAQTYAPGYEFDLNTYLSSANEAMEMHSIPMNIVNDIIEQAGCRVSEICADTWTGQYGSHTFFGFAKS